MTDKTLLPETELLRRINEALARRWPHPTRQCTVETLRRRLHDGPNWEVDIDSTSGEDLTHAPECNAVRQKVVEEFAAQYDVLWPQNDKPLNA